MKTKFIATLTDEQEQFLSANSSRIGENYFMPYWFRRIEGNTFELMPLGNLPESMTKEITEMRRQVERTLVYDFLGQPLSSGDKSLGRDEE